MGSLAVAALVPSVTMADSHVSSGGEFSLVGAVAGDQVHPQASLKSSGGYVVWQDNVTDGNGLGISARKLDSTLSPTLANFRVNQLSADDQENPQVSLLNSGGAVFVWQGGKQGKQRIYSRILNSAGTWQSGDVAVGTFTNDYQIGPVVATLSNGNYVVAWSSFNQAGSSAMQDIYFQLYTSAGVKIGTSELLANQTVTYNQRTPALAALSDGRFVLTWVSEQQTAENAIDIFARVFNADGTPAGNEFEVNTSTNIAANPAVAAGPGGTFAVAWGELDGTSVRTNGWDVYARVYNAAGAGGSVARINTTVRAGQYAPRISFDGSAYLLVWMSVGQDGSREGVFGQFLHVDGTPDGGEIAVNSTTANQQIQPFVATDGAGRFLTAWTSYGGGLNSFDLFAQRYASSTVALTAPDAPLVTALDSYRLQAAWPALAGYDVASYEIYADGSATATATVTNLYWWLSGLSPQSTHTFRLAYVLTDGRHSPLSAAASGTTWGYDNNFDGLPDDWQTTFWGPNQNNWPSPGADSDGDGMSNVREFLAGTDPTNSNSVLRLQLQPSSQGLFLNWNTQPGLVYQVQSSSNIGTWTNVGPARFAAGLTDSINVGGNGKTFYQVLRLR